MLLYQTKMYNKELIAGIKELKAARDKIKTKEYSDADRNIGVLRAIELGKQLGR